MRERLVPAGILILATAWGFVDGFFVAPRAIPFILALLLGTACLAMGEAAATVDELRVPRIRRGIARALFIVGLHLSMQPVVERVVAHHHRIEGAAQIGALLLRTAGIDAGVDAGGNLLAGRGDGIASFAMTWELAALPSLLRIMIAMAASGAGHPVWNGSAIVVVTGLRLIILVVAVSAGARFSLAYEPMITLLGFLPLVFVVRTRPPRPAGQPIRRVMLAMALAAISGICLGVRAGSTEAGAPGRGRVLIDESRSDWEWTSPAFDHARYGQKSLYSYSLWRAWIELHHATRVTTEPPTEADLGETEVLIIKTPTSPYDRATIDRIERFVRAGGGLYLIGDHTNLFGMSTVLNEISAPYGIRFEYDDTFPLDHEATDTFRPGWPAPHPVLRGITSYPFETSCTLRVPMNAEQVMIGRRLGAEMVDYGHMNFFGDIKLQPSERFGLFVQAAVVRHGRGRVAGFSDSTNFSNFSLLWPGRRELTVNLIDWLNREARSGPGPRDALLPAGVAMLLLVAVLLRRADCVARATGVWIGVLVFIAVAHMTAEHERVSLGMPEALRPYVTAGFDTSLGRPGIEEASAILSRTQGRSWVGFNAFFINAARSNIWPVIEPGFVTALARHDIVVVINPARPPTRLERGRLSAFLARGGRLLVIDSILNSRTGAAELLGVAGLDSERALARLDARSSGLAVPALGVRGKEGVVRHPLSGGGEAVVRDVGSGRVVVVTEGALFSDIALGGVYVMPTEEQREIYRGQEELLRLLLEPGHRTAGGLHGHR